jgi:uncharacterized protein (DUF58 family)
MTRPAPKEKVKTSVFLTKPGIFLLLILLAMLMASMNYSNNMAYSLCFLLMAMVAVAYIFTGNNVRGVTFCHFEPKIAFAGSQVEISVQLKNIARRHRQALFVIVEGRTSSSFFGPVSIAPQEIKTIKVSLDAPKRGKYTLKQLTIVSLFPLGLFRGRSIHPVGKDYIVFPKPKGLRPFPPAQQEEKESSEGFHFSGGEDFAGLRPYRLGESQRHVDWKAFARGRPLYIKEFTGGGAMQLWFDWHALFGVDVEERISQLTKWILAADKLGREYGLKLPQEEINPDSGTHHTMQCLTNLALFTLSR